MTVEHRIDRIASRHESVNEKLWRGELTAEELIELLKKIPPDANIRIYGNKLQAIAPNTKKVYTLDKVNYS